MPSLLQYSFAGGRVDNALLARNDLTKVITGLRRCDDWIITGIGSAMTRAGTRYRGSSRDGSSSARFVSYRYDASESYVIELGAKYLRLWSAGAVVLTGSHDAWSNSADYVPGDIVVGTDSAYYYCVATHTNKNPTTTAYQDDFWFPLTTSGGSAILEVPTPWAVDDLAALDFTPTGDTIFVTHRDYPPHEIVRTAATAWTCQPSRWVPDIAQPVIGAFTASGTSGSHTLRYQVAAITEAGSLLESLPGYDDDNEQGPSAVTNADSLTADLSVAQFAHGLVTGDRVTLTSVAVVDTNRAHENAVRMLEGHIFTVTRTDDNNFTLDDTAGLVTLPPLTTGAYPTFTVKFAPPWVELTSKQIPASGSGEVEFPWTAVPGAKAYRVYRSLDGAPYGFQAEVLTNSFRDEGQAADTDFRPKEYRNLFRYGHWPRASAVFQQRLFLANTATEPETVWSSVIGDVHDFSVHSTLEDADGMEFKAATQDSNEVLHLAGLGRLLIFTGGAVWIAAGDGAGGLSAAEPNLQPLSYEDVGSLQPLLLGDSVLYTNGNNSLVREVRFAPETGGVEGYQPRDMTRYSRDLFRGFTITSWAFSRVPDQIVWAVRSDGAVLGLSYLRDENVLAWHVHGTGGSTDSLLQTAVIREDGEDVPYFYVHREVDSSDEYYVETLDPRQIGIAGTDTRLVSYFVDCGVTYSGANSTATTLTLTGGTTWAADESGLTLTASAGLFPGDASNVGEGYRLVGADGSEVEVVVTGDASTTVQTVTLLTAAPASTRAAATATWVAMTVTVDGLDHLEGRSVVCLADGNHMGPFTVSGGAIAALSRPYGYIHTGLAYTPELELFEGNMTGPINTVLDRQQMTQTATLLLRDSHGLRVGPDSTHLAPYRASGDVATVPITGQRKATLPGRPAANGRMTIQQAEAKPAELLAVVRHMTIGEE